MNNEFNTMIDQTPPVATPFAEGSSNDAVIDILNGLIETCRDGQEGFKQAAEGTQAADLKKVFYDFSQQRASFVGELQDIVRTLGGDPENTGTISGAIHRGWMNIKAAVAGNDEAAILNECERGEDSAKGAYEKALENDLPTYIRQTLQTQYQTVMAAHDHVKELRDHFNNLQASTARTGF